MGSGNLRKISILSLVLWSLICFLAAASDQESKPAGYRIDKILKPENLKEEINLQGSTLKELFGEQPELAGLGKITLKTYLMPTKPDSPQTEILRSVIKQYRSKFDDESFQTIRFTIGEDKAIIIGGSETKGVRDKLIVVTIEANEISEMTLEGEIKLSALNTLRKVIADSLPSLEDEHTEDAVSPVPIRPTVSPSQQLNLKVLELQEKLEKERGDASPELYYNLAEAYRSMGKFKEALSYYNVLMDMQPLPEQMSINVYKYMAECSERLDKLDDAMIYYRLLLDKYGHIDNVVSEVSQAIEILEKRREKHLSESEENPLSVFYKIGEYERSVDSYREAGLDFEYANPPEKQIELFKELVEQDPRPLSEIHLALAYQRAGMHEQAIEQYDHIIESYPDSSYHLAEAYVNAGKSAEALDKIEEAKKYYTTAAQQFRGDHRFGVMAEKAMIRLERGESRPTLGLGLKFAGIISEDSGVPIVTVFRNGPCKDAGVHPGDKLLTIDSQPTNSARSVIKTIGWQKNIGDEVILKIRRGGQEMEIPVTLIKRPEKVER